MLRDPVEVAHAYHMEQLWARNEDVEDFEPRGGYKRRGGRVSFLLTVLHSSFSTSRSALFSPLIERLRLVPVQRFFYR